jgi:formate hydrogenlyase subunit 6/NADH:ubiquinone oxidoreductase subunit I
MLGSLKGMVVTMLSTLNGLRKPVTAQYPKQHLPIQPRYMGFPALTWDEKVEEPYCTACMVCIRNCPTQCMSATMKVCNFDAVEMSHEHELSVYERNGDRVDLNALLEMGLRYQKETDWIPPSERAERAKKGAAKPEEQPVGAQTTGEAES